MERSDKVNDHDTNTKNSNWRLAETSDLQTLSFRGLMQDISRLGDALRSLGGRNPAG